MPELAFVGAAFLQDKNREDNIDDDVNERVVLLFWSGLRGGFLFFRHGDKSVNERPAK
jgi:hypothetical protein